MQTTVYLHLHSSVSKHKGGDNMVIFGSGQLANRFWIWPGNDVMRKGPREGIKPDLAAGHENLADVLHIVGLDLLVIGP